MSTLRAAGILVVLVAAGCAPQQPTPVAGPAGPAVTVSPGTVVAGRSTLTVSGTGFDEAKGIYVAYCLEPAPGEPPTPCGGGVDTSGEAGLSSWISSNPPPYGEGLAKPYGPDGSFTVGIVVSPRIGDIDCREQTCGIATRADHTRSTDRTQDVFVPIEFKE
ncbi:MAG: hypothetical protein H6526_07460 [Actinobacteria bacterium]|nr:hypothetical protein [Actinomycetota bacterium]MCB8996706.1 hypothetical protein [Actinomycetota bacterium]MCB9415105.1 hypothetical protein [Actinomycetota bacterium]